jgi:hypothetical protein
MAGGLTTALVLFLLSGAAEHVPTTVAIIALAALSILTLARDFRLMTIRLPENRRLIPEDVFRKGPLRSAARFGYELGTGLRTYVPSTVPYLAAAAILLLRPSLIDVLAIGAAFGLGRFLMTVLRFTTNDVADWDARLTRTSPTLVATAAIVGTADLTILITRIHL